MIRYDYDFIYNRLKERGYKLDVLRSEKILSQSTLQCLRHDQPVSTNTINILCALLDCQPQDFIHSIPGGPEEALILRLAKYTSVMSVLKEEAPGHTE